MCQTSPVPLKAKLPTHGRFSCLLSSLAQAECQPEENEDAKSEEKSRGNQNPFRVRGEKKWWR